MSTQKSSKNLRFLIWSNRDCIQQFSQAKADIFTIDINKVVLFHGVSGNNGKDLYYIVGYQVDGDMIIPLIIKAPKSIFSFGVSQHDKNLAHTMSFNVYEIPELVIHYQNIWNEVELQLFKNLTKEPLKEEAKYTQGKLKAWKKRIKTDFHGQEVPYDIYCKEY